MTIESDFISFRMSNIVVIYLKNTYIILKRLSSRLFLVSTYQHINEKSEILFSASVLQKNVICRVGFLYWKENPLSIRTPSTWDSKPEILHFSRLQFHACFQITLDAQVLTHSAHFCWPSKAASEYRAYKKGTLSFSYIC